MKIVDKIYKCQMSEAGLGMWELPCYELYLPTSLFTAAMGNTGIDESFPLSAIANKPKHETAVSKRNVAGDFRTLFTDGGSLFTLHSPKSTF